MKQIDEVLMALRRVIRAADLHSKHLSKTAGLTAPQLLILQTLARSGPRSVGGIGRAISLGQATVTTIINRLEKRGYVRREKSSRDRRVVMVVLTDAGRDAVNGAPQALQEKFVRQFQSLDAWEQSMILSSLQRVAAMMDASGIDASPIIDVGDLSRGPGDEYRNTGEVATSPAGPAVPAADTSSH